MKSTKTFFVTGATGFIGKRVVKNLLEKGHRVFALCREGSEPKLLRYLEKKKTDLKNLTLVCGDVCLKEVIRDDRILRTVVHETTHVIHGAAIYDLAVSRPVAKRINVDGTRNVLELARKMPHLERFTHLSTIAVSGDYQGIFYEEMLDVGQGFTDHYARTKFVAEKLVREWENRLPVTIVRPGAVTGEMKTGETEKFDGPYFILKLLHTFRWWHPFTPGRDQSYIETIPVDVVADFTVELSLDSKTQGRTFTIVDPEPLTLAEFIDLACEYMGTYKPLFKVSLKPASAFVRLPVIKEVLHFAGKQLGYPVEGVHYLTRNVLHDASNTLEFSARKGLRLPHITEYFEPMLKFLEKEGL